MTRRSTRAQNIHRFVLVLRGVSEPDERIEDALYEAGCDDAILAFRNSVGYLEFDREADSMESAILSAVQDVERAGQALKVAHVEPDDVVNASEIARRWECSREYVRLLAQGRRGEGGFPLPLAGVTSSVWLWSWAGVMRWRVEHQKVDDESRLAEAEAIRDMNIALSHRLYPGTAERPRDLLRKLRRHG